MREHEKVIDEKLRHRKKSKTASISNSSKRADHKHQYERVIVKSFLGYRWGRKCSVCGRFDDRLKYALSANSRDFMKAEAIGKPGICYSDYLSIAEIRSKYPDVPIFELGEGYQYKEIENELLENKFRPSATGRNLQIPKSASCRMFMPARAVLLVPQ